jgi:tetratricopeptide (TPR) repeat protein
MKPYLFVLFVILFFPPLNSYSRNDQNSDSLLNVLRTTNKDSIKVKAYINLATYFLYEDINRAEAYLDTALFIASKKHLKKYEDIIPYIFGNIYFLKGDYKLSLDFFLRYLKIQEEKNNKKGIAKAYAGIGTVHYSQKNLDKALSFYQKSLDIFNQIELQDTDLSNKSRIINNIANIYGDRNEDQKALDHYKLAYSNAKRSGDIVNLGNICNNIGKLFLHMNMRDSAFVYFNEGLEIRKKGHDFVGLAKSYKNLSKYYYETKDYDKAIEHLLKAYDLSNKTGELITIVEINELLAELYEKTNQYELAYKHLKSAEYAKDSLFNATITKEIARKELQFEYEKKEKLFQLEQQKKEFRLYIITAVLSFIVIIIGLLYFLSRSKEKRNILQRENLKLEKQNLEKELEIRNKELTTNVMYLVKKNEFLNLISKELLSLKEKISDDNNKQLVQTLIYNIQHSMDSDVWDEFEIRFQNVHSGFYDKLNSKFPGLSANEKKLCAYLKLNMTTKEIAALLHRNEKSIAVARSRLRKKLHLTNTDIELVSFLSNL